MTQPGADPLVGRTVAQYEIVARLGGGGMGVVYRAIDRKLGRPVALKFLPQQWSHDEGAKQRFLREAQAASATDHPNICTIHDIATADDGQLFIVMAYYAGETLKRRLEAGTLPIDEALDIATQVADGLARAHAQGIVHRDIKPGNLILTEDGVRIVDFGLATFVDALQLTVEGSTLGTAAYMSPEQVRGEEVDARTDVWAVGVVLYQMLVGHTPFRGAYAEAIGYAIRNDPPPPLRAERPEIPEDVEQLVFRALHKDPAIRFPTGRELARALRQVRGLTVPMDLRTVPVAAPVVAKPRSRFSRRTRTLAALAAILLLAALPAFVMMPAERLPVAVIPAVNETGEPELNGYRLAVTHELVRQLSDSRVVRVVPYERLLQIVRPFRASGKDPSSNEAVNAVRRQTGATVLITPRILQANGTWTIRVDYQNAAELNDTGSDQVTSEATVLRNEAVYGLTAPLVARMREHFTGVAGLRVSLAERVRNALGRGSGGAVRMRTLETAALFEQGLDFYEQQEHDDARALFARAAEADPRNPLLHAWHSRAAWAMRQDDEAADAADRATALMVAARMPRSDRLFIEASAAEARGVNEVAAQAYRALADDFPDEPTRLIDLAAYEDRQLRNENATTGYHAALALDRRLVRPHVELCRLYRRRNLLVNAREEGTLALAGYGDLGARAGEMHALWCLSDVLSARADDARQARAYADRALAIAEDLGYDFNRSRSLNYVALAAAAQGNMPEAIDFWTRAADLAAKVGNMPLQPLALMNVGVANQRLGNVGPAVEFSRRSAAGFKALGQEQRAAEIQANTAQIVLDYGGDTTSLRRDIDNALAVFRRFKDRHFEAFCLHLLASFHRHQGRYAAAETEVVKGLAVAGAGDLNENKVRLLIDRSSITFDLGNYQSARALLAEARMLDTGPNGPEIAVRLGRAHVRLGELDAARGELNAARQTIEAGGTTVMRPLLHLALGELEQRSGASAAARMHFERAALPVNAEFPDDASVQAAAELGLLDALNGKSDAGRRALITSLEHAQRMGRHALAARSRLYLAKTYAIQRRFSEAERVLDQIPADDNDRTVGAELRAAISALRAEVLAQSG